MNITSAEIRTKMQTLDDSVVDLEIQFENLSVALLVGDTDAGQQLADVQQQLDRLGVERKILAAGLTRAYQAEKEAREKEIAARRGSVVKAVRSKIEKLFAECEELDQMRSQYLAKVEAVRQLEGESTSDLRSVRAMPEGSIIGRHGLGDLALSRLSAEGAGTLIFLSDQRGVAEVARKGWEFLFEEQPDEQEAA